MRRTPDRRTSSTGGLPKATFGDAIKSNCRGGGTFGQSSERVCYCNEQIAKDSRISPAAVTSAKQL